MVHGGTSGTGLSIGVVTARPSDDVVERLIGGATRTLEALKVRRIVEASVSDCFGLPLAAKLQADSGEVDAIVCLGVLIQSTTGLESVVATECGRGLQDVQLRTGLPVLLGVVLVDSMEQAMARSEGPGGYNLGSEAASGAVEMARLRQKWLPLARS